MLRHQRGRAGLNPSANRATGETHSATSARSARNAGAINDVLEQPVTLRVRIRRPTAGKPSYTIIGYDWRENGVWMPTCGRVVVLTSGG